MRPHTSRTIAKACLRSPLARREDRADAQRRYALAGGSRGARSPLRTFPESSPLGTEDVQSFHDSGRAGKCGGALYPKAATARWRAPALGPPGDRRRPLRRMADRQVRMATGAESGAGFAYCSPKPGCTPRPRVEISLAERNGSTLIG